MTNEELKELCANIANQYIGCEEISERIRAIELPKAVVNECSTTADLEKRVKNFEIEIINEIKNRDKWEEKASDLACKVGEYFCIEVGEHSSSNCPIEEALKILNGEYVTKFDELEKQVKDLRKENSELRKLLADSAAKMQTHHRAMSSIRVTEDDRYVLAKIETVLESDEK